MYVLVFFFFQAEDGIRDGHVTGVQTCALPISLRLIRESRHLIDDDYRRNPENRRLFIELFNYPSGLVEQLKPMSRYGVLGPYLPASGPVTGQMQPHLFHVYSADSHTINVVENC